MRIALTLALVAGCPTPNDASMGSASVCYDPAPGGGDLDVELDATVTAVDDASSACGDQSTLLDDGGNEIAVGLTLLDEAGADITPAFDVEPDDLVSLLYRYRLVWGSAAGLVLSDDDGTLLAADEGGWGGALEPGDVPGLEVQRGDEPIATRPTDCQPLELFDIAFRADEEVRVSSGASADIALDGVPFTALAVAAVDLGESTNCTVSDATGVTSGAVARTPAP